MSRTIAVPHTARSDINLALLLPPGAEKLFSSVSYIKNEETIKTDSYNHK
jgi:hypothetical protein